MFSAIAGPVSYEPRDVAIFTLSKLTGAVDMLAFPS